MIDAGLARKGASRVPMLEAFAMSDQGCVRGNNEDYCLMEPELGLYVLADGMGGAKAGERASRLAVETVAEMVQSRRIARFAGAADGGGRGQPAGAGGGAAAIAAWKGWAPRWWRRSRTADGLDIASVGDSRAYMLDDERPARHHRRPDVGQRSGPAAGSGRTDPAPPSHAPRADDGDWGQRAAHRELLRGALESGSLVLMCSDGLHGVVEAGELQRILEAGTERRAARGDLPPS